MLLINATPAGTEALKNLILPGIGKFTIADTHLVSTADRGNNFFVTEESIGKPRAEATRELLGELNSDTVACAMHGADASTFAKDPDKLKPFNLIMCCDLTEQEIVGLAKACSLLGKPLIISETMGLLGYVRVYKPEHCVVESKPVDEVESDLRLHKPFAEFVDFAAKFNLEYLDEIHHKHVPFPIILLKAKDMWKSTHAGKLPANFAEKKEFSEMIKKMAHDFTSEDNFIEAVAHVPKCFLLDDVNNSILTKLCRLSLESR